MPNTKEMELWQLVNKAFQNSIEKFGDIFAKDVTRDLLDNGVTVQKWTPVAEGLPALHIEKYEEPDGSDMQVDVSGFQWVITASGRQTKARYETGPLFQGWVGEDSRTVRDVTHWMPLPEPPKGE